MTNFRTVFQVLFTQRFKRVINLWLLTAVILVGSVVVTWFTHRDAFLGGSTFKGLLVVLGMTALLMDIVLICEFAFDDQRVWVQPVWRALPTRTWHLYVGALLADIAGLALYWIGVGIVAIGFGVADSGWGFDQLSAKLWFDFFATIGLWLVLHAFVWAIISTVRMATLSVFTFLPDRKARLLRGGVSVLMAIVVLYILQLVGKVVAMPFDQMFLLTASSNQTFLAAIGWLLLLAVVASGVNLLMLNRWVEADV